MLSYGSTWETTCPIAYNSMALKDTQLNYPTHEKELLVVIHTLTKWCSNLLSSPITIYTDHQTLENFDIQKDLSHWQAQWQEFLAHYNHQIVYIKGEDNMVANTLSHLPNSVDDVPPVLAVTMLSLSTDLGLVKSIIASYDIDPFCVKLSNNDKSIDSVCCENKLLYVGDCLFISHISILHEDLFWLTHNTLGHFGFNKSYASLQDTCYWPNMHCDCFKHISLYVLTVYIIRAEWQRHLDHSTHYPSQITMTIQSLLILLDHCPIITITDCLGADVCIAPTYLDITVEYFAAQFFELWYCKNGLPLEIISNQDKLFVSKFWKVLHGLLTRAKLKLLLAYHPETNGSSEHSNKTVAQALRYHVDQHQRSWAKALPLVHFNMMNTINTLTGYLPFQLWMGRSPQVIPLSWMLSKLTSSENIPMQVR